MAPRPPAMRPHCNCYGVSRVKFGGQFVRYMSSGELRMQTWRGFYLGSAEYSTSEGFSTSNTGLLLCPAGHCQRQCMTMVRGYRVNGKSWIYDIPFWLAAGISFSSAKVWRLSTRLSTSALSAAFHEHR